MHEDISDKIEVLTNDYGDSICCRECGSNVFYKDNKQCISCNRIYEKPEPIRFSPTEEEMNKRFFNAFMRIERGKPHITDSICSLVNENAVFKVEPNDVKAWSMKEEEK